MKKIFFSSLLFILPSINIHTNNKLHQDITALTRKLKSLAHFLNSDESIEEKRMRSSLPLDVYIALGSEQNFASISTTLSRSIKFNVPFIASSHFVGIILDPPDFNPIAIVDVPTLETIQKEARTILENSLTPTGDYVLYKTKKIGNNPGTFLIGLPRRYWDTYTSKNPWRGRSIDVANKDNLDFIGINKDVCEPITTRDFDHIKLLSKIPKTGGSIDIEELKSIFSHNTFSPLRVFLNGHGIYSGELVGSSIQALIADLSLPQYRDFLQFLNKLGTQFLYVSTCYAGGYNLLAPYQKENENATPLQLNYFVMIRATTDSVEWSSAAKANIKTFFQAVDTFLQDEHKESSRHLSIDELRKNKPKVLKQIENIISSVHINLPELKMNLSNIPSFRYPGSINYFKTIEALSNSGIVTYSLTTAKKLARPLGEFKFTNKDAVLIYTPIVDVPLTIETQQQSTIISMIPGDALHYFEKITHTYPQSVEILEKQLNDLFFLISIASHKLFFIKNFKFKDLTSPVVYKNVHNCLVLKNPSSFYRFIPTTHSGDVFYQDSSNNKYYHIYVEGNLTDQGDFIVVLEDPKEVPLSKVQAEYRKFVSSLKLDQTAFTQASGGQISIADVKEKIEQNLFLAGHS